MGRPGRVGASTTLRPSSMAATIREGARLTDPGDGAELSRVDPRQGAEGASGPGEDTTGHFGNRIPGTAVAQDQAHQLELGEHSRAVTPQPLARSGLGRDPIPRRRREGIRGYSTALIRGYSTALIRGYGTALIRGHGTALVRGYGTALVPATAPR